MEKPAVAVLGLGLMGSGMAQNLLRAGFPLTVYNRSREKAEILAQSGARVAQTPRDAAQGADVVISMVADDSAARAVWLGEVGALQGMKSGSVAVEASTVTVEWIRSLTAEAASRGVNVLDAPVTGSRDQASDGELLFLVGGSDEVLGRVQEVLASMARGVLHVGESGSGATLKLVNNFLCGVELAALAEAVAMIEGSRLNPERAVEMLMSGAAGSPIMKALSERMLGRDYEPRFALELMGKDLRYASKEAARVGVESQMAPAAGRVVERAVRAGVGNRDIASIVEQFRR